ncbi:MAG: FecR domain-containing protein [Cellvibrio sp.]|uniref:FecR domain-containing protein n=1 Tax=Cellvibrio sp. TaxID=1965322 RepID=UPI0031A55BCE
MRIMNEAARLEPLSPETLEAAARWYVQLNDVELGDDSSAGQRKAWEQWLAADETHRQAWTRMEALERRLTGLPADIAAPTLATAGATIQRRRTVKVLGALIAAGAFTAFFPQIESGVQWARADYRTRTGERRQVVLADGGILDINTDSAVDIEYSDNLRKLHLLRGDVLIQTAKDPHRRPFEVHTSHGRIRALGTRFTVSYQLGQTRVAVLEDSIEIHPAAGAVVRLDAGQQATFSASGVLPVTPAAVGEGAWSQGKLVVIEQRLADFLAELERHRPGKIVCAASIADMRLSGAFRLNDTDALLDNLAASLPIKLRYFTRYWVSVEPK